jgi:hypothetical protein
MPVGYCKFCKRDDRNLVEAHIVPKAFYGLNEFRGPLVGISNVGGQKPKRMPVGVYDSKMICDSCEDNYSHLDDYAAKVLKPWPRRSQLFRDDHGFILKHEGIQAGYWVKGIDENKLLLFFIFLVLRFALTSRSEFAIELSTKQKNKLLAALVARDAAKADIDLLAFRYIEKNWKLVLSPWPRKNRGKRPLGVLLYGLKFLVFFKRQIKLADVAFRNGRLPVIFVNFKGSTIHKFGMWAAKTFPDPWAGLRAKGLV